MPASISVTPVQLLLGLVSVVVLMPSFVTFREPPTSVIAPVHTSGLFTVVLPAALAIGSNVTFPCSAAGLAIVATVVLPLPIRLPPIIVMGQLIVPLLWKKAASVPTS